MLLVRRAKVCLTVLFVDGHAPLFGHPHQIIPEALRRRDRLPSLLDDKLVVTPVLLGVNVRCAPVSIVRDVLPACGPSALSLTGLLSAATTSQRWPYRCPARAWRGRVGRPPAWRSSSTRRRSAYSLRTLAFVRAVRAAQDSFRRRLFDMTSGLDGVGGVHQ